MVRLRVCNRYRNNGETTRTIDCMAAKRHLSNVDGRSSHAAAVSAIVTIEHGEPTLFLFLRNNMRIYHRRGGGGAHEKYTNETKNKGRNPDMGKQKRCHSRIEFGYLPAMLCLLAG